MSFFTFTQACRSCNARWNASFGIVGTTQIGDSRKTCPKCGDDAVYTVPAAPPSPSQPVASPDQYCVTEADGNCVSTDPRCMHNAMPAVAAPTPEEAHKKLEKMAQDWRFRNQKFDCRRFNGDELDFMMAAFAADYTASLEARNAALSATLREVRKMLPECVHAAKSISANCWICKVRALLSRIRRAK